MAVLTPLVISGCSGHVNQPTTQAIPSTTLDSSSKKLETENSILQDFKQRYIDEYNKVNGTDFGIYDIELHMIPQTYLYVTYDNQYITHGKFPDETRKILVQYDKDIKGISSNSYDGYVDLIQITRNNQNLESASSFYPRNGNNNIFTPVLSATDDNLLSELKAKKGLKENILCKYYKLAKIVMDLHNSYDKNSKKIYIQQYNDIISELDNLTTSFETTSFEKE